MSVDVIAARDASCAQSRGSPPAIESLRADQNHSPAWHKSDRILPPSKLRRPQARSAQRQGARPERSKRRPEQWRAPAREKNPRERYGREAARQPINCGRGQQKPGTTENQQNHRRQFWYEQVSRGRARVALIKRPVNEPVEKHGCRAREHHTDNH